MPNSLPLYYAGVASDDDVLEEMLKKDKKLEHGSSSTIDLQRLLGVSYQQVPLSRVKKMTAAVITVVAIILFISLSFHSAATSTDEAQIMASTTSPKEGIVSDSQILTTTTSPKGEDTATEITRDNPGKATSKKLKENKKNLIPTTKAKIANRKTTTLHPVTKKRPLKQGKSTTTTTSITQTTRKPTLLTQNFPNLRHTDIVPIPTRTPSDFVLAMNPSIPGNINLDCHSCAVVTNSADLYMSNAGSVIDSSDCVIRLNVAPTIGHEDDVGGKTTVRVVSQDHLGDLLHYVWRDPDEISSLSYVITYGKYNHLCKNCTFFKLFKKVSGEYLGDKFIRFTKTLNTNSLSRHAEAVSLSTQFHAIDIMRKVCRKMRVFGVEKNHPCLSNRSYMKNYWQRNKYIRCDGRRKEIVDDMRRYRFEKDIYNDWVEKYDLEFLYP